MTDEARQRRSGPSFDQGPTHAASHAGSSKGGSAVSASLDDVMLAMDVVDTLRHEQRLIERELTAGDRDRHLIERLRGIYASQGIAVADDVLAEGVAALHEDRFTYTPPAPGLGRALQIAYVNRGRSAKYLLAVIVVAVAAAAVVVLS